MTKKLKRILMAMEDSGDTQQHAVAECLTTIAGNGNEQANDAYILGCARALRNASQSVIDHMTPKPKKAQGATVEPNAHTALLELATLIVARYGKAVEHDEEIAGSDAVDSIGCYVDLANDAIDMDRHYATHAAQHTEFLTMLARMKTEEEYGEDAPPSEDWISTLNDLIAGARALTKKGQIPMLHPPARPLTQRHQGEANHTALLDAQGNWIAILKLNGEMTTTQQDELLASILRAYNHYETMHQALLKAKQHILQLSHTVNTLSERQGLGQKVRAIDFYEGIDAALAHAQVREVPPRPTSNESGNTRPRT